MSNGNLFLGYARGSVGDVVMARVKGQQVAKARNRKPANPKTNKQVQQRASFIGPVKFFTHGVQALFKFAFSDKKVTESDFNAFMRNNSKASFPMTKAEHASSGFPALGNYMLTKGKLPELPITNRSDGSNMLCIALPGFSDIENIGVLSAALVELYGVAEGDIITLLQIYQPVQNMGPTELSILPSRAPMWFLDQFVVDTSDSTYLWDAFKNWRFYDLDEGPGLYHDGYEEDPARVLASCACVVSRQTALGLEVSNSYLHNGGYIDQYIEYRNTKAQVDKVLADWGATGDAILQGSIAKK